VAVWSVTDDTIATPHARPTARQRASQAEMSPRDSCAPGIALAADCTSVESSIWLDGVTAARAPCAGAGTITEGGTEMRRVLSVTCGLLLLASAAWAADIEGTVKSIDMGDRAIVLEDGTRLVVAEGLNLDNVQEGKKVKLSYEEREGKNVVTTIDVTE
jgi:hypothetical protein